jgi:sarcosine oxidase subunit beta
MRAVALLESPPRTAELVVVGAGVIGAATAHAARRAGLDAVVVEAKPALASATTAVATGAYRLQQDDPDELVLVRETVAALRDFAAFSGQARYDPGARATGLLSLTTTEEGAAAQRATAAHQRSLGVDGIEILDGDEARRRFPYLAREVLQARVRMDDGVLEPRQLALGLLAGSAVPVATRCRVLGFELAGDRIAGVRTSRGTIATGACVIAAGPLSGIVAALAGVDLPVRALRRHRLVLPDVPHVPPGAPLTYDDDTGAHWRPALRGAYALISHADQTPSEAVADPVADPDFPWQVLDPASPTSVARLSPFWREVWADGRAPWTLQCGFYTLTPDYRPLLDETHVAGLYVNTGYSGHGVMSSVGGARHLLELVTGARRENPFALGRAFVPPRAKPR